MRKIILLFIIIFSFFIGSLIAKAEEINIGLSNIIIKRYNKPNSIQSNVKMYTDVKSGALLFDLNPFVSESFRATKAKVNNDISHVAIENKKLAYVGELLYKETNDSNYFGITQKLIWDNCIGISDNTRYIKYLKLDATQDDNFFKYYENIIKNRVLEMFPDMTLADNYDIDLNKNSEFKDDNNVLKDYQIVKVDGDSVASAIYENSLFLTALRSGTTTITLRKYVDLKDYDMQLYERDGYSNLISAGNFSIDKTITFNVIADDTPNNESDDNVLDTDNIEDEEVLNEEINTNDKEEIIGKVGEDLLYDNVSVKEDNLIEITVPDTKSEIYYNFLLLGVWYVLKKN